MRAPGIIRHFHPDLPLDPAAPWPPPGIEMSVEHSELRVDGGTNNAALAWQAKAAVSCCRDQRQIAVLGEIEATCGASTDPVDPTGALRQVKPNNAVVTRCSHGAFTTALGQHVNQGRTASLAVVDRSAGDVFKAGFVSTSATGRRLKDQGGAVATTAISIRSRIFERTGARVQ